MALVSGRTGFWSSLPCPSESTANTENAGALRRQADGEMLGLEGRFGGMQFSQRREQQGGEECEGEFHRFGSIRFHLVVSSSYWKPSYRKSPVPPIMQASAALGSWSSG